jgi:hypothetical protein
MKLKDLFEMGMGAATTSAGVGGAAATTSANVQGVPKPVGAVITREYAGYDADRRKKKKKKDANTFSAPTWKHYKSPMRRPMHEEEAHGEAVNPSDRKNADDGNATKLGRLAFKGDRPRYKPKKTFITRKPAKPKDIKEQDEWEPLQQRTPAMDLEWLRRGFEGDRPGYVPKKQKITKKDKSHKGIKKSVPVEEQFMGPQLFYDSSPYNDLEFLVKFWRGSKKGELMRPESAPKRKKREDKPLGTYGTSMPTSSTPPKSAT